MRHFLTLMAAFIAAGFIAVIAATAASAAPSPKVLAATAAPTMVEKVDYWRRQWRRRGYDPYAVPNIVVEGAPIIVERPPVVVVPMMPPPRPLSCGQYKFWNGERCIDARYNPVDVGPK